MKTKAQKVLEKGTLIRETIHGVFTEIDDRWFLSLENCLVQIVDKANGGIKALDDIEVRVVPDHKSLERELSLLEKVVAKTMPEEAANNIDHVSAFAQKIIQYSPRFTQFLSEEEQKKYRQLFTRAAELMSSLTISHNLDQKIIDYETPVKEALRTGNIFVSRYGDLGSQILAMKEKLEDIYKIFECIDKKDYDKDLIEVRKAVETPLNRIRRLAKKSLLQIKQANKKDLPDILKLFDYFTNRFTEYRSRAENSAQKKTTLQYHEKRLNEHYVFLLDGTIVGGVRASAPTEEDRENIGYRVLRSKDNNIMINGFGSSAVLDKNIAQAIKEAHLFLINELKCWRVYTGMIMKDISALEKLEKGELNSAYAISNLPPIHSAMVDAGFMPFKTARYNARDRELHNIKGFNGELIYRTSGTRNDHPGRSA